MSVSEGKHKKSAKGVTKHAQKKLKHEAFKTVLTSALMVRVVNNRIASSNHRIETIATNKIALTSFDNKRYIMSDKISSLPFGHYSIRDDVFNRMILDDSDWAEDETSEASEETQHVAELVTASNWKAPDMGFHQREYTESELGDVVDLDQLSILEEEEEQESLNPFIDFEAEEVSDEEEMSRKRRKRSNFVIESDSD